jgi:hypothetical protein
MCAFEMELYRQLESFFHPHDYRELPVWRGAFPATPSGADGSFASGRSSVESEDSWFHPERWQTAVHEECRLLRDLIKRTQRDRESLISTPLLMHWVASIDHQRLQAVENVTHLYHEVVWQHLRRFRQQTDMAQEPSVHTDGSGESLAITALTRIALIMLQTNDLRLTPRKVCSLLGHPVPSEQLSELGADDNFWTRKAVDLPAGTAPAAAPVRSVSYYSACFDDRQTAAVLRCGLLRESDQQVAFLHDSLVYYFAGVLGLLHYRGPEVAYELEKVPDSWSEKVAARITSQPAQWLLAAEFLGGRLAPMQGLDSPFDARLDVTATSRSKWDLPSHRVLAVEKLVYHSLLAPPHPSLPGLLLRLLRGFGHEADNVVLRGTETCACPTGPN